MNWNVLVLCENPVGFPQCQWVASFLFSFENQERRKKTFLLRFSFSFLLVEKKERKKRKRVRSVLGGMMKMMLLGWEQNNQK